MISAFFPLSSVLYETLRLVLCTTGMYLSARSNPLPIFGREAAIGASIIVTSIREPAHPPGQERIDRPQAGLPAS